MSVYYNISNLHGCGLRYDNGRRSDGRVAQIGCHQSIDYGKRCSVFSASPTLGYTWQPSAWSQPHQVQRGLLLSKKTILLLDRLQWKKSTFTSTNLLWTRSTGTNALVVALMDQADTEGWIDLLDYDGKDLIVAAVFNLVTQELFKLDLANRSINKKILAYVLLKMRSRSFTKPQCINCRMLKFLSGHLSWKS